MPPATALSTTGCSASERPNRVTASYCAVITFCIAASNFWGSKSGTEIQSTLQFLSFSTSRAKSVPFMTAMPKGLFCTMMVAMRICFLATWSTGRTNMEAPGGAFSSRGGDERLPARSYHPVHPRRPFRRPSGR